MLHWQIFAEVRCTVLLYSAVRSFVSCIKKPPQHKKTFCEVQILSRISCVVILCRISSVIILCSNLRGEQTLKYDDI